MHTDPFVWRLFVTLRDRHRLPLGTADLIALHQCLRAGFGWDSPEALRSVCTHLWARSVDDREAIAVCFDALSRERNAADATPDDAPTEPAEATDVSVSTAVRADAPGSTASPVALTDAPRTGASLRPLSLDGVALPTRPLRLEPQYPIRERESAQLWRRLRAMVRQGPATELDVEATVHQRARTGVAAAPVLRAPRKNAARALVLVDRQGSMTPYHPYIDMLTRSLAARAALAQVAVYYFHNAPAEGADRAPLKRLKSRTFPTLDRVLGEIAPLARGDVYARPDLTEPESLDGVLARHADGARVLIVTDAGAARGRYDVVRLLDSLSFARALATRGARSVWLNPVARGRWAGSTAEQLARHVPMFTLDPDGLLRAVRVLQGIAPALELPL